MKCAAISCSSPVGKDCLFCPYHWAKVPDHLQHTLIREYTPGQFAMGGHMKVTGEFALAGVRAVSAVALKERLISERDAERRERDALKVIHMYRQPAIKRSDEKT